MATRFIGTEATGLYIGTLVEDMIDTVKREKKLYCNVWIEELFQKDSEYPLTYVPFWAMSLPLRKDDKVLVEFHQNNLMYPVLYKNPSEIDSQFYTKFNIPQGVTGGHANQPSAVETVAAEWIGKDSYIIKTDDYTLIHQNNGYICLDKNDKLYIQGSEINLISTGTLNIDSSGQLNITGKGNVMINNHLQVTV